MIPIDEEHSPEVPALEIHAVTVEDDGAEAAIEISHDEPPEELSLDDLEEVPLLAEPKPYSAAARKALTATPLFASLSGAALESMIDHLALVDLVAGDTLFRQGDAGTTLYVVVDGEVAVVSEGPPRIEVSRLGPGAFFGEVALVTEQPRSATIEATTTTQLLAIDRDVIGALDASLVEEIRSLHAGGSPISPIIARQVLARFRGGAVADTGPVKILTSCPSCLQGLSRYTGDLNNGLLEADYIVVEMANKILGPDWLPDYVERANDGGIERVLV